MQKIAIVQESPVLLNRHKTIEMAVGLVEQAAAADAELVETKGSVPLSRKTR